MRKVTVLALVSGSLIAAGPLGTVASASPTGRTPLCGTGMMISSGSCTYYPETKTGHLSISGTGHAHVVCSGGGEAQLTSTGGSKSTTFQRAVFSSLLPCVLDWAGTGSFGAGAD